MASIIKRQDWSINILHTFNELFELVNRDIHFPFDERMSDREHAYKDSDHVLAVLVEPSLETWEVILANELLQRGYALSILDWGAHQADWFLRILKCDKIFRTTEDGSLLCLIKLERWLHS